MKIFKVKVYDTEESVIASGYPMLTKYEPREAATIQDWRRAARLANNDTASGHCNFLKGIRVSADILASIKWWIEADRYSHFDIVSSMSTMHKGTSMPLKEVCPGIPDDMLKIIEQAQAKCLDGEIPVAEFVKLLPTGLEYAARISTNYLQLKIMYKQRRQHMLPEWQTFCDWCEELPNRKEFIVPIPL